MKKRDIEYWCVLLLASEYGFHTVTTFATPRVDVSDTEMLETLERYAVKGLGIPAGTEYRVIYSSVTAERA
ncbi:hypothetical protein SEA_MOAB_257 [Streptomyces phage Moab]|nr:hypothetical protein SEA_MOAB_257 [Streptomyces phage Moab]